uniref:Uncharacterized protein n=1 Tax=Siphoviridae sp. ctVJE9 TaxID=2825530 RepID=A0A8S5TUM5_9CAUD|nr:MAG TPA: hypothetical protein [Siphoviridae sp. ctVJE9]
MPPLVRQYFAVKRKPEAEDLPFDYFLSPVYLRPLLTGLLYYTLLEYGIP